MKTIGNIIWVLFGGLELALGYFTSGLALCITIIGIPFGLQIFKLGVLALWPFGHNVRKTGQDSGSLFPIYYWACCSISPSSAFPLANSISNWPA